MQQPGTDAAVKAMTARSCPGRSGLWEARIPGVRVSGAALAEIGLAIAPQRTLTAVVVLIEAL